MFLKCEKGQRLTITEEVAINYINENVENIADLTISEIAEKAFVSPSTISRAIRKCGIEKLSDVRIQLAMKDIAEKNYIANDILDKSYQECIKTIERIDTSAVLKIAKYIKKAKRIHILANGITRLMAQVFEAQLQWQGYPAYVQWDLAVMRKLDVLVDEEDVVMVFSMTNNTPDLAIGAKLAKEKGAKVIVCCCREGTLLEEVADVVLIGVTSDIVANKGLGSTSLVPLHIIGRTIMEYLSIE